MAKHFQPGETVYCRFTGEAFTVVACNGCVAELSDGTGRIVGELTRSIPIPADAPWQMHDPFIRNRPYFRMLFALTPAGGHAYKVFFNRDVEADWVEHVADARAGGSSEYMSYPEWCGIAPCRLDRNLVWC